MERTLELTSKGPLILLTGFQTPTALCQLGADALEAWLGEHGVCRGAAGLAARVVQPASSQTVTLPGEQLAELLISQLAEAVVDLNEQIKQIDMLIDDRFHRHELAEFIESMPGIGVLLGAEFLAATGGDMSVFASADHLAGYAGLALAPRDSGRISGKPAGAEWSTQAHSRCPSGPVSSAVMTTARAVPSLAPSLAPSPVL